MRRKLVFKSKKTDEEKMLKDYVEVIIESLLKVNFDYLKEAQEKEREIGMEHEELRKAKNCYNILHVMKA